MKRRFLFILTSVLFVAAIPFFTVSATDNFSNVVMVQEELTFNDVELSEVPAVVIEAAQKEHPGAKVEKAKVAEVSGKKVYKVILKTEDGESESGLYNSDGSSYSPQE